ncbi:hypothetical protein B0H14DRAFT_2573837 [Mycena olivaceomarginata]|nr:hypothetical protein B0H14DRAFT_2573837 [Mycena olivaceomarginata]
MTSIDSRRSRISEIDEEIAQLQAERQALVESLIFPVYTLPVEIIFKFSCIASRTILSLQWRDIVLSLPDLWSSWSLAIDGNISCGALATGVDLWLSRSQSRPLSIRLHHRDGDAQDGRWWDRVYGFEYAVLPKILPHHRRWQNIEINVPLSALWTMANIIPADGLPYLTHLLLGSVQSDWDDEDEVNPITLFANAPQLRSLHLMLESQYRLERFGNVQLPYEALTSFTDAVPGRLCFYIDSPAENIVALSPTLSHLKSLKLFATKANIRPVKILDNLTLPALETLVLGRGEVLAPTYFISFVSRSKCTIRHFSCHYIRAPRLVQYLYSMPTLTTLELLDYEQPAAAQFIRDLNRELTTNSIDPPLIPNLQSLMIQYQKDNWQGEEFSYNALLGLLDTMSVRTPLRRVRLWTISPLLPRKPNEWEVGRLRGLVERGMDIYVGNQERSWI